ncbi:ubiquitin-associated protein 2-like isoform X4 [Clupea harengus]|uniref:Ubiquitin-associated protein 2-like isoform X4 n=1 Tax=Clupea harengus TaxID=7950 RepID=A0A8M1K8M6_CLUHA|nr:ubiquitin-associated protein 2-like isoform X4 [Clupea harengus]
MMTSLGSDRARGSRDKVLPATTQNSQPQKQPQATAEQIRLAQMIYDKNDADFEDKVKQLMEVTGKNQDECMVALHDSNEDVNRAINFLLEGTSDTTASWETVGKKKVGKDSGPSESKENRENRDRRGEREGSRGRGGPSKRGRGGSRSRPGEVRAEENGVEPAPVERGADHGRRGRGRVAGTRGRGRAPGTSRFTAQGMGWVHLQHWHSGGDTETFNPADYTTEAGRAAAQAQAENWEAGANDATDGPVAWRSPLEDWAAEDWSEDLSETKVFTASCAPTTENHVTAGQSLDLASLLQKPAGREEVGGGLKAPSSAPLGHSLVFTNSHHHATRNGGTTPGTASYAHATLSSVLGSGFGELGGPKLGQSAGAQILEQLKGPGLGPLPTQPPSSSGANHTPVVGGLGGTAGPAAPPPSSTMVSSSWDVKPPVTQASMAMPSQFSREFKMQPEPSLVLSQLAQRQTPNALSHASPLPLARQQPSPPPASSAPAGLLEPFPKLPEPLLLQQQQQMHDAQAAANAQQQRQMKTQKRRIPPSSKIPSSAVEMPGSADVLGLNVQFGALDFGSESAMPDFSAPSEVGTTTNSSSTISSDAARDTPAVSQTQSSLYSKPISEALTNPVPLLMPMSSADIIYSSASVPMPSLAPSLSIASAAPMSSVTSSSSASSAASSFDCGVPPHSRLAFSQSKEAPGPVTNGYNGVRTSAALDSTSASSTPKPESPSLGSTGSGPPSAPSAHLPPSMPPHSTTLSSLAAEHPSASLPPLSSHVSSVHSALPTSSSHTHSSVDSVNSLAPPASVAYSGAQTAGLPISSGGSMGMVSNSAMLHGSGVLGLTANGTTNNANTVSAMRAAPLLSSSTSKAPPNLSQGVPPLLPNQYIMGPGGLLPAYPQIYGYEDLHMLQSRLPMDYYGITFPGPAAALSSRDGGLANNPYSGEVTKFGRGDSTSPAPPSSLSAGHAGQAPQAQQQGQSGSGNAPQTQGHHAAQQAFLNPALPPGYSYTGLPYYPGMPGVPNAFQYAPTMFVPPASAKQHGMGLSNAPQATPFQQPSSYGQHTFSSGTASHSYGQQTLSSGYDDLTQGPAGADYSKGYSSSNQTQAKSAASGPGKGVSVTSSNSGVPDISGTVYNKTQSFDKQGFHAGTPPPFSLPSALGGTGQLNPGGAPGYAPAPFLHILPPHQQPHSQLLHHHLSQDTQGGLNQRSQSSSMQQKTQVNKSSYGSSPYWGN